MLRGKWLLSWLAVAAYLLASKQQAAAQDTGAANSPDAAKDFSPSFQAEAASSSQLGADTQAELSDFELMLVSRQTFRTGSKNTRNYHVRVCEISEFTGGGSLRWSLRAKASHCDCTRFELKYGTPNDRGISLVAMTPDEFGYIQGSCSHSYQIYR